MQPITLCLTTPAGDELGRLRLEHVLVASAGDPHATPTEGPIASQMETLYHRITEALDQQGVTCTCDPIDLAISVSRALLGADGAEELCVSVPVREGRGLPKAGSAPGGFPAFETDTWDDLFPRDLLTEGGSDHATL